MGRLMKKIKNKQYGQAMVEFALTVPIFLLAVLGVIELSRFFLVYSSVYTASREATRFASSVGEQGITNYQDCDQIKQVAVNSGWFGGVNADNININYESSPGQLIGTCVIGSPFDAKLGNRVVVEISTNYQPITPILPTIPINTSNARTIMMDIAVKATPMPPPVCLDDMNFVSNSPQYLSASQKDKLYIDIENTSKNANYQLVSVYDIDWDNTKPPARYLQNITWDSKPIWNVEDENVDTDPPIDVEEFEVGFNKNIPSETIIRLIFIFDKNVPETIMKFRITFQNLNPMFQNQDCEMSIGY